jgi:hypothetical protein
MLQKAFLTFKSLGFSCGSLVLVLGFPLTPYILFSSPEAYADSPQNYNDYNTNNVPFSPFPGPKWDFQPPNSSPGSQFSGYDYQKSTRDFLWNSSKNNVLPLSPLQKKQAEAAVSPVEKHIQQEIQKFPCFLANQENLAKGKSFNTTDCMSE